MTDFPAHARRTGRDLSRAMITAAFGAMLLLANPATAQLLPYSQEDEPLPPPTISRMLLRQGYEPLGRPRFQGDVYMVSALSPAGARVRLMVDAYNGSIIRSTRLDDVRPAPGVREFLDRDVDLDSLDDVPPRVGRMQPLPGDEPPRVERRQPEFEDEPSPVQRLDPQFRDESLRVQPPQPQRERKATRDETPARPPAAPAPSRRSAQPSAPATTPAAPAPVAEKPKPDQPAAQNKPAATAAAPTPAAKPDAPVITPPAPAAEASKSAPSKPASSKTAERSAEEKPAATTGAQSQPVRIIEGVTPIRPQDRPGEGAAKN